MIRPLIALSAGFIISATTANAQPVGMARPHVLVYKTKTNCRCKVPVVLSSDKKTVVSYPDPADVQTGSNNLLPVSLHKGYLLDQRGVGLNTAFLNISYKKYSKLNAVPTQKELYAMIADKDPLTELYDCGVKDDSKNSKKALNQLIKSDRLRKECTVIK